MIANMRYDEPRPVLTKAEALTLAVLIVIAAGTAYEAGIAFGWISIGDVPGEEARFQGLVLPATGVALLVGIGAAIASSGRNRLIAILAPAAAAFMVARFYGFDPYYAPTLRRDSDGGAFSPFWVWSLAVPALIAATVAHTRPRGGFLTAPVMLLCEFTAFFVDVGH